jgi:hypothetical protein
MTILGIYLLAGAAGAVLLYLLGVQRWYWHTMAVLAALVVGLLPPPAGTGGDGFYIVTGSLFAFLIVWGAGAPVVRLLRVPVRIGRAHQHARAA